MEGGVEPGGRRIILRVAGRFVLWGAEGRAEPCAETCVEGCVEPCVEARVEACAEACVQHGMRRVVDAAGKADIWAYVCRYSGSVSECVCTQVNDGIHMAAQKSVISGPHA